MKWPPRNEAIKKARIKRGEYWCQGYRKRKHKVPASIIKDGKRVRNIYCDHIDPVIDPRIGFVSWQDTVERMFCEESGFQILCLDCHSRKGDDERHLRFRSNKPTTRLLYSAKANAKRKGLPYNLDNKWLKDNWTGFCQISGIPFNLEYKGDRNIFLPSIDRIIPDKGYVKGNCRFILWGLNALKGADTDEDMYKIIEAVYKTKIENK